MEESKKNPFYETDLVNGFTNNGFYDGWLPNNNVITKKNNINYVTVYSSNDISKAILNYLETNYENKSIIVKNTGHDYIGRSCPNEDNCLVLWTHKMINIRWERENIIYKNNETILISNKKNSTGSNLVRSSSPPMFRLNSYELDPRHIKDYSKIAPLGHYTIEAGVQWYKVFDFMLKETGNDNNNIDVWAMKGASNTVGAAGGWILDGGFGLFSKLYGMGIDNVIAMEVILADGTIHEISEEKEQELFQTFRGSGACNFGIVSKVTYKLLEALTSYGDIFMHFDCSKMDDEEYIKFLSIIFNSGFMVGAFFGGTLQIFRDKIDCFIQYGNISFNNIIEGYVKNFIDEIEDLFKNIKYFNKDFNENITTIFSNGTLDKNTFDFTVGIKSHYVIVNEQLNNTMVGKKFETISTKRWWTYESYNDYIVAFGSSYLLYSDIIKHNDYCAKVFLEVLKHANMIQIEISKGLYGAPEEILAINRKSFVNPKVRQAVGLIYIRSYLVNFKPDVKQPYSVLKTVKFKYEKEEPLKNAIEILDKSLLENKNIKNDNDKIQEMYNLIMEYARISKEKVYKGIQILKENIGDNSTYINHSDYNEERWERNFYGDKNFKKLVELKNKYDPNNLFKHKFSIPLNVPEYMLDEPEIDIEPDINFDIN